MAIRCCLLHSIPGRVRIRVESALIFDKLRDPFEAFLRKQPGIRDVSMNSTCRSLVLTFDPAIRTPADLLHLLETLPLDQFKASAMGACQTSRTKDQDSNFWIPLGLSTAAVALGLFESVLAPWLLAGAAIPIFRRTYDTLMEKGKLNVDVLDAAATTVLTLQGQIQTATTMVWLVSLGECIRDITMQQSRRAIEGLFDRQADSAWIVRQGRKVQVNVGDIKEGDEVVVYPGELIPVDGTVLRGKATVDQKVLTGESLPVEKAAADAVFATTVVRDGKLYVEAAKVGSETAAANIIRLVRDAPIRETRVQNYAEEFGDRLVPWSFLGAGASYLATSNLNTAASLLIVDYGTGIRVAAPTTVLSSMTKAARQGIFIKGGRHLERLTEIDTIIFDKTGTLTTGSPEVVKVLPFGKQVTTEQVLAFAAAAEERLTHPVAEAIVRAARSHGIAVPERKDSRYTIGLGVEASVDGSVTLVGCQRFMIMKGIADSRKINRFLKMNGRPVSPVFAAVDGQLIGLIEYTDPLRPEAPAVIRALQERGLKEIVMLTGDHPIMA
ncbi:MAG: heavy metal translocating P-type ATPase, partial [Nitrospiraceae bacterium]